MDLAKEVLRNLPVVFPGPVKEFTLRLKIAQKPYIVWPLGLRALGLGLQVSGV